MQASRACHREEKPKNPRAILACSANSSQLWSSAAPKTLRSSFEALGNCFKLLQNSYKTRETCGNDCHKQSKTSRSPKRNCTRICGASKGVGMIWRCCCARIPHARFGHRPPAQAACGRAAGQTRSGQSGRPILISFRSRFFFFSGPPVVSLRPLAPYLNGHFLVFVHMISFFGDADWSSGISFWFLWRRQMGLYIWVFGGGGVFILFFQWV